MLSATLSDFSSFEPHTPLSLWLFEGSKEAEFHFLYSPLSYKE